MCQTTVSLLWNQHKKKPQSLAFGSQVAHQPKFSEGCVLNIIHFRLEKNKFLIFNKSMMHTWHICWWCWFLFRYSSLPAQPRHSPAWERRAFYSNCKKGWGLLAPLSTYTVPKIWNKYSQKWNCADWFLISTFTPLGEIYLFLLCLIWNLIHSQS